LAPAGAGLHSGASEQLDRLVQTQFDFIRKAVDSAREALRQTRRRESPRCRERSI
jgi:hypothetical protein